MKFIIRRTSLYDDGVSPYPGAIQEQVPRYDIRTCTEEHFNQYIAGIVGRMTTPRLKWRDFGTEHTVLPNGHIKRRMPKDETVWTIELNSLEELISLEKEVGKLVISHDAYINMHSIEIYDTYRE